MTSLYRQGVGGVIINNNKKVLIGRRMDYTEAWQMPQGGINKLEDPTTAILRELKEEIGTNKVNIFDQTSMLYYVFPDSVQKNLFNGKYIGQQQIWFFMHFLGTNKDINPNQNDHPEFSEFKWMNMSEVINLVVDFKKEMYKQIYCYAKKNNYLN